MKMFVPLFVGLYKYMFIKKLHGKLLFYDFWKNPLVWREFQKIASFLGLIVKKQLLPQIRARCR